jgi:hypothetical protein
MHETAVLEALLTRIGKGEQRPMVEQLYNHGAMGHNAIEVYAPAAQTRRQRPGRAHVVWARRYDRDLIQG